MFLSWTIREECQHTRRGEQWGAGWLLVVACRGRCGAAAAGLICWHLLFSALNYFEAVLWSRADRGVKQDCSLTARSPLPRSTRACLLACRVSCLQRPTHLNKPLVRLVALNDIFRDRPFYKGHFMPALDLY